MRSVLTMSTTVDQFPDPFVRRAGLLSRRDAPSSLERLRSATPRQGG